MTRNAENERRALDLIESMDAILWSAQMDPPRVSFARGGGLAALGYAPEEWTDGSDIWSRISHPDELLHTLDLFRKVASDGRERQLAHRVRTARGDERWFRTSVRAMPQRENEAREICGLMLDVTARRKSGQLLGESDIRLRLILDQVPAIIWTVDKELRFTSGMGAVMAKLGVSGDGSLAGVSLYEYFKETHPGQRAIHAHLCALAGETVKYENVWFDNTYECKVEPFRDRAGTIIGAIGVALDISDRKRAEQERQALLGAEKRARGLAEAACSARDEFLSIASHELRTPVTSIQLVLQSLLRGARHLGPAVPESALEVAENQARRLRVLIDQLLDVSRIQTGRFYLDVGEVDIAAEARRIIAAHARAMILLDAPPTLVGMWDRARVDQLFENLIANAIAYGGDEPIEVSIAAKLGDTVDIEVRDHGAGIPAERLPHIFELFERSATGGRHYGGLGLGLYIVDEIVKAHGGSIVVDSEVGRGSTFRITLPHLAAGNKDVA